MSKCQDFETIGESRRPLPEQRYRQNQKIDAISRVTALDTFSIRQAHVAHDLNNLLTIIAFCSDSLIDLSDENEPVREIATELTHAAELGTNLIRELTSFNRNQPRVTEPTNVNAVILASQRMLQILAGKALRFELDLHVGECPVAVAPNRLEQILMNLVANSRDAMPHGGLIKISTALVDPGEHNVATGMGLKAEKYVELRVSDTGNGIPAEIQPHIFESFFTTKGGEGRGNGLSIVYGIVRRHDGHISCESVVGKGATFTILLPAAEQPATAREAEAPSEVRSGSPTVLLVEDEPGLRVSVQRILEQNGYKAVTAADACAALKASDERGNDFDLLITDIAIGQMGGTELAGRLLERNPGLRVLYMSGYAAEELPLNAAHCIRKPFRREALIRALREVLAS